MDKVAFGAALSRFAREKLGPGLWNAGKLLVTGNEVEGAMTGARMLTGYQPSLPVALGLGFGFDFARPTLGRVVRTIDHLGLQRYGDQGVYGDIRKSLGSAANKFTSVSKLAPLADVAGMVQMGSMGFNQFDPKTSMEMAQDRTLDTVANSLGWDDAGGMRADLQQFQPILRGMRGLSNAATSTANRLRSGALQNRLGQLPEEDLNFFTNQAFQDYGPAFADRSVYDQAAIIDSLVRNAQRRGLGY